MPTNSIAEDVSAVVCTWNAAATIDDCLQSLKENQVGEIILVDADSDDRTREIAKKYTDKILSDPREGLARARNIGITEASKKYVLNVGADNVMPTGSINKMLQYIQDNGYSGVSAMTFLKDSDRNYISWAMNCYKKARYYSGERNVIGTPTLFTAKLLKENPYDNKMSWSDDGDLCDRFRKNGHRFAVSDVVVYEIGSENLRSVLYRWKGYGKSDWEVYTKNKPEWKFTRKIYSLTHPLRNELIFPFMRIPGVNRIFALPFLWLITFIRYFYWVKYSINSILFKGVG